MSPARLIGNFAAIFGSVIVAAVLYDWFAAWEGWKPWGLCYVIQPVVNLAGAIGVLFTTIGLLVWALSWFRSEKALALTLGGVGLFLVPLLLPHYLGASCIP